MTPKAWNLGLPPEKEIKGQPFTWMYQGAKTWNHSFIGLAWFQQATEPLNEKTV